MRRLFLAAGLLGALAGHSFASPTITVAPSNMHKSANPTSAVVQAVPANAEVHIRRCRGDWCYGSWRGLYGFLPAFAVGQAGPPPGVAPPVVFAPPPPPLLVAAPLVVAPVYHWSGPYVGVGVGW